MKIDASLIKSIASLSRLNLTEQETEKFTQDFSDILSAFRVLDEADVAGIKSSFRPYEERDVLREDIARESLPVDDALKFTKNKENGFFVGPKTVE